MIGLLTISVLLLGGQGSVKGLPPQVGEVPRSGDGGARLETPEPKAQSLKPFMLLSPQPSALSTQQPLASEFVAGKGDWIQKPVTLKSLRGKVVLVDFWAYTCVNCIRTFPYIKEWYRRYHNDGFEIVAIHHPEFDFEGQRANVVAATKRFGFAFPVLNDLRGKNWANYGVSAWPTKILVDANGRIVYAHVGEGRYDTMEACIQQELMKIHPKLAFHGTMAPVRPTDAPGAVCHACSLEAYAAKADFLLLHPSLRGKKTMFAYPAKLQHGFYFRGSWTPLSAYVEEHGDAAFTCEYMAKEVNSVLRPSTGTVTATVYQDGKPIAANELGDDVKMINGQPTLRISEPRMYSVIRNPSWGIHRLEIRFREPGARLYTLTFGTDCRPLPRRR